MRKYLSRRKPYRLPRKQFIISSEGKKTEPRYLKKFDSNSNTIRIHIVDNRIGNDPISVVEAAKRYIKENDLRKNDEIWVVVDTDFSYDTRQKRGIQLTGAGKQCKNLGFGYAVSNR